MKPAPAILRRTPFAGSRSLIEAPVKQRIDHSMLSLAMGAFQLRTQGLMDYLSNTLLKTW